MVMELIRAASLQWEVFYARTLSSLRYSPLPYSVAPFSPINHCSLFLNKTLNVVNDP
jgi:hypothetical protein